MPPREPDPAHPAPEHDPRDPGGFGEEERARALRALSRRLQVGGGAFLVIVSLGLLPTVLSSVSPALGRAAAVAAWVVAPIVAVSLLVFAALRLRR